jgi:plasmid stabilization system protein ParE
MDFSFHPDAEKELEKAENYDDNISQELGNRFRAETEMAISRILDFPNAWQRLSQETRRRAFKTFLYGIVYRVKTDEIRILAVMHLHRKPNYWAERV